MATETKATIQSMIVYKAYAEVDQNEGRGGRRLIGYFLDCTLAAHAVKGQGVWGTDGTVESTQVDVAVYIDDDTNERVIRILGETIKKEYQTPGEVRAHALSKLTKREKEALGVK